MKLLVTVFSQYLLARQLVSALETKKVMNLQYMYE